MPQLMASGTKEAGRQLSGGTQNTDPSCSRVLQVAADTLPKTCMRRAKSCGRACTPADRACQLLLLAQKVLHLTRHEEIRVDGAGQIHTVFELPAPAALARSCQAEHIIAAQDEPAFQRGKRPASRRHSCSRHGQEGCPEKTPSFPDRKGAQRLLPGQQDFVHFLACAAGTAGI